MMDENAFEAEVSLQIAQARRLASQFQTLISPMRLNKLEQDIRAAFTFAVSKDPLNLTTEERIQQIKNRMKWDESKSKNPNITPVEHIMRVYPDREELGMLRRDLKDKDVDPQLYQALSDWLRPKSDGSRNDLPPDFKLPKKSEATDAVLAEMSATSKSLTKLLNIPDAKLARAVNARHSRTFRSKAIPKKHIHRLAAE